jgi:hypothetical protein
MAFLGSNANVYNTCLNILRNRKYRLWITGGWGKDGEWYPLSVLWHAEKNGDHVYAENPIELLGLTAIYEYVNPTGEALGEAQYWWGVDGPDIWSELNEAAFPPEQGEETNHPEHEGLSQVDQESRKEQDIT